MGGLARKMARAAKNNKRERTASSPSPRKIDITEEGLFCDCLGTLFSFNLDRNELLVDYLNAQYASGRRVYLISTDPHSVYDGISNIGLNPGIVRTLNSKRLFYGSVLEELIDDDPMPLIKARTLHNPNDKKFKDLMREYLETPSLKAAPAP